MTGIIHHINFLVRDLDAAIPMYEKLLGRAVERRDHLPGRGVDIAGFRLGDTWLLLVQPVAPDTAPARHLERHGEGFFLLSLAVDDLGEALSASGLPPAGEARAGLDGWQVQDLDPTSTFGAQLQLCQAPQAVGR